MAANLVVFFIDDTDYAEKARKEAEKQQRKEERRKEKLEQRAREREANGKPTKKLKNMPIWKRNKRLKLVLDLVVYAVYALVIAYIAYSMYTWYHNFQEQKLKHGDSFGYESRTGEGWSADKYEEEGNNEL